LSQRDETRKPVDILQSFDFPHHSIVTSFRRQEKWPSSRKADGFLHLKGQNLPTRFCDDPEKFQRLAPSRKQLVDTVKLIAYRAETAMAAILRR